MQQNPLSLSNVYNWCKQKLYAAKNFNMGIYFYNITTIWLLGEISFTDRSPTFKKQTTAPSVKTPAFSYCSYKLSKLTHQLYNQQLSKTLDTFQCSEPKTAYRRTQKHLRYVFKGSTRTPPSLWLRMKRTAVSLQSATTSIQQCFCSAL